MRTYLIATVLAVALTTPVLAQTNAIIGDKNHHNTLINGGVTNNTANVGLNKNVNVGINAQKQRQRQTQTQVQVQDQRQTQGNTQSTNFEASKATTAPSVAVYSSHACGLGIGVSGGFVASAGITFTYAAERCELREDMRMICGNFGPNHPACLALAQKVAEKYGATMAPQRRAETVSATTSTAPVTGACVYDAQNPYACRRF